MSPPFSGTTSKQRRNSGVLPAYFMDVSCLAYSSTLKIETVYSSETVIFTGLLGVMELVVTSALRPSVEGVWEQSAEESILASAEVMRMQREVLNVELHNLCSSPYIVGADYDSEEEVGGV
jgi:hypothetical protein